MEKLKTEIKELLVSRLKLDMSPGDIKDDTPLFGEGLSLDSIDALEVVVGLRKEFDFVIADRSLAEKILVDVNTIAKHIEESKKA